MDVELFTLVPFSDEDANDRSIEKEKIEHSFSSQPEVKELVKDFDRIHHGIRIAGTQYLLDFAEW